MPYYASYIYNEYVPNSTGTTSTWYPVPFTAAQVQQQYEEYRQGREQQEREMEQSMRESEEQCYQEMLRQEEMKKYPLFFWKETCEPILDLKKKKIV